MSKGEIIAKWTMEIAPWKPHFHIKPYWDTTPCAWIDKKLADSGLRPDATMTNEAASKQEKFIELCKMAGIEPTPRQASKFRNGLGVLWKKYKS